MFDNLKAAVSDTAVEKLLMTADEHTKLIFQQGYTRTQLPYWANHVTLQNQEENTTEEEGGSSSQPKQVKIAAFSKVS